MPLVLNPLLFLTWAIPPVLQVAGPLCRPRGRGVLHPHREALPSRTAGRALPSPCLQVILKILHSP